MQKNIMFFGDSNTWGYNPVNGLRYPFESRWTSIASQLLGDKYCCIPVGMNGRTTIFDDPIKGCRNGHDAIDYELQTHKPLDMIVIMLGTNDLKYTDAAGSARGMDTMIDTVLSANVRNSLSSPVFPCGTKILLVSPPIVLYSEELAVWSEESKKLANLYQALAEKYGIDYLDASKVTPPSEVDNVHLGFEGHMKLGNAIAQKIKEIFGEI